MATGAAHQAVENRFDLIVSGVAGEHEVEPVGDDELLQLGVACFAQSPFVATAHVQLDQGKSRPQALRRRAHVDSFGAGLGT